MNNTLNDNLIEMISPSVDQPVPNDLKGIIIPEIAKWYNNFDCAVSLRFDDNLDSHVKFVIPLLNQFGLKATFMTNPGRNNHFINYNRHKNFWENEAPLMGHRIGNHTMHHRGAKNVEEAEYEIGEVSKLIWKLYPNESKLNVFASGGGEKWNGKRWRKASDEFKEILPKYHLIDLYSSQNSGIELNSNFNQQKWEKLIEDTVANKRHQQLIFHKIGNQNIIDFLKELLTGFNNCFAEEQLLNLIKYLDSNKSKIWIAPIVQVLKYKTEFESATLNLLDDSKFESSYELKITTDPNLYDQELSLIINTQKNGGLFKIFQNGSEVMVNRKSRNEYIMNVKPENSRIEFNFL